MPPYQEILDLLENHYTPHHLWCEQWYLIQEMAWLIEDTSAYLNNRVILGKAIKDGIRCAYRQQQIPIPSNKDLNKIKENAIKDMESFRSTPEFWQHIR